MKKISTHAWNFQKTTTTRRHDVIFFKHHVVPSCRRGSLKFLKNLTSLLALTIFAAPLYAENLLDNVLDNDTPKPTRPNLPDIINPDAAKQLDDQDLLNKLTGQTENTTGDSPTSKMNQIAERMDQSETRLTEEKDTGLTTQEVQSRIIIDLDAMIEILKKQQHSSKSQSQSPPKEGDQRQQSQQQQQAQQPGSQSAQESQLRGDGITQPTTSGTELREDRAQWAELPPKDRDLVANGTKEKFLPEYADMIKRYYEALADLGKSEKSDKEP